MAVQIRKLTEDEAEVAIQVFKVMASAFEEKMGKVSHDYAARLLSREDFWVFGAFDKDESVGGLTAFVLPLTRSESSELFIYDIAVLPSHRRKGIGRSLVQAAIHYAKQIGIAPTWVPADNEDDHALEFYRALGGSPAPVTIFTFS